MIYSGHSALLFLFYVAFSDILCVVSAKESGAVGLNLIPLYSLISQVWYMGSVLFGPAIALQAGKLDERFNPFTTQACKMSGL